MEVTTPKQMEPGKGELDSAVQKFEQILFREEKGQPYYHIVIGGEINEKICSLIEATYIAAGWSKVVCKTSSMNGERPGLTGLQLWT